MNTLLNSLDHNTLAAMVIITGAMSIFGLIYWVMSNDFKELK